MTGRGGTDRLAIIEHNAVSVVKLVGMSMALSGWFRDLG
jgi:hypothetical protein